MNPPKSAKRGHEIRKQCNRGVKPLMIFTVSLFHSLSLVFLLCCHFPSALIASETGTAVAYALFNLQDRGVMFIDPQTPVYHGMIVGEHSRDNDLEINVLKGKKLTNMRASGTDEAVTLTPPRRMSLEDMMAYVEFDELLEVTPTSLRLRKRYLLEHERKKFRRQMEEAK